MIKKTSKIIFEILGFFVAAALVAGVFFLWSLSQGAINIGFVNPYIEETLGSINPDIRVKIKDTTLAWDGYDSPFTFMVHGISVTDKNGREVTGASRVGISFSAAKLVTGRFFPTEITLFEPEMTAKHLTDGSFDLNIGKSDNKDAEGNADIMAAIMTELKQPISGSRPAGLLTKVTVTGAKILYTDEIHRISLQAANSDLTLIRDDEGIIGVSTVNITLPKGDETLRAELSYNRFKNKFRLSGVILGINPEKLIDVAPEKLTALKDVKIPISLKAETVLSDAFIPETAEISIETQKGTVNYKDLFAKELTVEFAAAKIRYDSKSGIFKLENSDIRFADFTAKATGAYTVNDKKDAVIGAEASLNDVPFDVLKQYWPHSLATNAQEWVTTRISKGRAPSATLNFSATAPGGDFGKMKIEKLEGKINVNEATVNYLPPMPPVEKVSGSASYTAKDFTIKTTSGTIGNINLKSGDIVISGLEKDTQLMDIRLNTEGPFGEIMKLIDNKPLGFAARMNMKPENFEGLANAEVTLSFPLLNDLLVDDVKVTVNGTVKDAVAKEIVLKKTLSSPELKLAVTNDNLKVDGNGLFADIPASFTWIEQFDSKKVPLRTIDVQTAFPIKKLGNLDITFMQPYSDGLAEASVSFVSENEHKSMLSVKADLTQTSIDFKPVYYKKDTGKKATLSLQIPLKDYELSTVDSISYAEGENSLNGSVVLDKNGGFTNLSFPHAKLNRNNCAVFIEGKNTAAKPMKITVKGDTADAAPYLKSDEDETAGDKEKEKKDEDKNNLSVVFNVKKLYLDEAETGFWEKAKGVVTLKNDDKERVEADAFAGTSDIYLRFVPDGKGGYKLRFETSDAGAMMKGLGLKFADVKGGKLVIDGKADAANPYLLAGTYDADKFTVSDAPLLARIINAFSLTGVLDLLQSSGLHFGGAHGKFSHTDDTLTLKNGAAYGDSVGFGFDGSIYLPNKNIEMSGTVIPAYKINQIMSNIPLVGDILTGEKNEGLLAAKFSVKGKGSEADVSVNPLSALTPGILRSIFFDSKPESANPKKP